MKRGRPRTETGKLARVVTGYAFHGASVRQAALLAGVSKSVAGRLVKQLGISRSQRIALALRNGAEAIEAFIKEEHKA